MKILITLDTSWLFPYSDVTVRVHAGSRATFPSAGTALERPNYPWLDDTLRDIVLCCTAIHLPDRPTLHWLWNAITEQIRDKTAEYYANNNAPSAAYETDESIQDFMQYLIFYPDYMADR